MPKPLTRMQWWLVPVKSIPNTRKLATNAVLAAGGHIHRQGVSETLLVSLTIVIYWLNRITGHISWKP